ncbi:Malic enzyme, N-terminal domain [Dillenia turbinata]|uniref:Malic enzyme, N-terminal domain n=1 Tax=Dillenia turbinata TaxID=194707 RepID=A0AAN8ZB86_9MAGN
MYAAAAAGIDPQRVISAALSMFNHAIASTLSMDMDIFMHLEASASVGALTHQHNALARKADVYKSFHTLPVMLDVGTSNQKLLQDPLFVDFIFFHLNGNWTALGLREPRLEGEEYPSIVDEFMEAVHTRCPKAIVQGTAGVALAGLLGTVRAQGRPLSDFVKQKIVLVGDGSAGFGVLSMAVQAVSRMAGSSETAANYSLVLTEDCPRASHELKKRETYNGHLVNCDTWMNIHLRECRMVTGFSECQNATFVGILSSLSSR